jgi:DeoR/GlpR family transcriptional regulator of sugar metabolism
MPDHERLLERMEETFTTADAQAEADAFDVTERTIRSWIGNLQAEGKGTKLSRGTYRKA